MQRKKLKQRIINESSGCIIYLKELVNARRIYDGEILEVIMLVITNGPESLTAPQWDVLLEKTLLPDYYAECERCKEPILWADMYRAIFITKDHCCSFCSFLENKEDVRLLE